MNSIQYIFDVECDNAVECEPMEEIEDNSVQLELINPFYEVKYEKLINLSFDIDEWVLFLILIFFVSIAILIKLQNMDLILGIW